MVARGPSWAGPSGRSPTPTSCLSSLPQQGTGSDKHPLLRLVSCPPSRPHVAGPGHLVHPGLLLFLPQLTEPSPQTATITAAEVGVLWGTGTWAGLDLGSGGSSWGKDRDLGWGPGDIRRLPRSLYHQLACQGGVGLADPEKASWRLRKLLMFRNGIWAVRVSHPCC